MSGLMEMAFWVVREVFVNRAGQNKNQNQNQDRIMIGCMIPGMHVATIGWQY